MSGLEQIIRDNIFFFAAFVVLILFFFFLWIISLSLKLKRLEERNRELFAGNKVANLEDLLLAQAKNLKTLDRDIQELFNISNQINKLALRGLHKIGMIRFNPFKDVGGDQSFAIAILNGKNTGITISSLYTREGARIYSKSIMEGKSEKYPLTEEEKQAIEMAINNRSDMTNQR